MLADVIPPGAVTLTRMAFLQMAGEQLRRKRFALPRALASARAPGPAAGGQRLRASVEHIIICDIFIVC
jgi:hypothetical protein